MLVVKVKKPFSQPRSGLSQGLGLPYRTIQDMTDRMSDREVNVTARRLHVDLNVVFMFLFLSCQLLTVDMRWIKCLFLAIVAV